ncbi:unnamed protein product [Schistocephalus solidus]|uniref:Uncharacterized protein n=1 Tax=Schistocephalus solidus TaxID=70667 RepID=A0A183TJG3_SCHSO|nr:unnamed protein product [Schistocephalus solidus]
MKSDLRDNMEGKPVPVLVSEAEGKNAASSIGAFAYIECSGGGHIMERSGAPVNSVVNEGGVETSHSGMRSDAAPQSVNDAAGQRGTVKSASDVTLQ